MLVQQGCIEALIQSVLIHKFKPNVQANAMIALSNLSMLDTERARRILTLRGLDAVLLAMIRFGCAARVQAKICSFLAILEGNNEDMASLIVREGGVGLIARAMMVCLSDRNL